MEQAKNIRGCGKVTNTITMGYTKCSAPPIRGKSLEKGIDSKSGSNTHRRNQSFQDPSSSPFHKVNGQESCNGHLVMIVTPEDGPSGCTCCAKISGDNLADTSTILAFATS